MAVRRIEHRRCTDAECNHLIIRASYTDEEGPTVCPACGKPTQYASLHRHRSSHFLSHTDGPPRPPAANGLRTVRVGKDELTVPELDARLTEYNRKLHRVNPDMTAHVNTDPSSFDAQTDQIRQRAYDEQTAVGVDDNVRKAYKATVETVKQQATAEALAQNENPIPVVNRALKELGSKRDFAAGVTRELPPPRAAGQAAPIAVD